MIRYDTISRFLLSVSYDTVQSQVRGRRSDMIRYDRISRFAVPLHFQCRDSFSGVFLPSRASAFRSPLSFFSATPSGQLLPRFGRELEVVDRSVPAGRHGTINFLPGTTLGVVRRTGVSSVCHVVQYKYIPQCFHSRTHARISPHLISILHAEWQIIPASDIIQHCQGGGCRGTATRKTTTTMAEAAAEAMTIATGKVAATNSCRP